MVLKSEPFYWLECDKCGRRSTEDGEFAAWADGGQAEGDAMDSGWHVEGGRHLCEKCITRCPECREVLAEGVTVCSDPECAPDAAPDGLGTV